MDENKHVEEVETELQSRRAFFAGLGKWSAIVIAGILLSDGETDAAETNRATNVLKQKKKLRQPQMDRKLRQPQMDRKIRQPQMAAVQKFPKQ